MNRLNVLAAIASAGACISSASAQLVYSRFVMNTSLSPAVVSPNWEVGEYFWEAILDAGVNFGIAPVSADVALREGVAV